MSYAVSNRIFNAVIYTVLIVMCVIFIVPFLQVITISLSPPAEVNRYGLHLFPRVIDLQGYKTVLAHKYLWISYGNTIIRTICGTLLSITLTVLGAYPLSNKGLPYRKLWMALLIFTMYFQGGLIPNYIIVRNLGLLDTLGALILPGAINTYTMIVVRNFFMSLPESLQESAKIDGANDFQVLIRIILPLSTPILATIALWYGVGNWNAWFDCMIYMKSPNRLVLQLILRQILISGQFENVASDSAVVVNTETMKMATLIVSTLPIMCVYPFLQKYFVKGIMMGAVKG